jgi:sialic acid synthase SpsE/mannose-6-phosphate isomerase-like protein (cupin superfamily)|tara:strand:- start:6907 stop:8370 length:1464 start_codon:yes stop_codon:yes gene_type:complete
MFYIFEMANNHQGSVKHAKYIIDEFSEIANETGVNAAVKLQFRQLDSFIHKEYKQSDLKFVKRFNSTRLSKEQFGEIIEHIRDTGLSVVATPFDNESLPWFEELNVPIVKVASCSIDDWPLLNEICKINKRIIISTGGATIETLRKVYNLFKHNNRDFAFMHCIGEYPTPVENSNLNRINILREEFPDIEIGFSTHESPEVDSLAPTAVAMGCTIVEKHVGVPTDTISLNAYSNTPQQMKKAIQEIQIIQSALCGTSETEVESLAALKRGVYLNRDVTEGEILSEGDFYYAMPCQENQYNVSSIEEIVGTIAAKDLSVDKALKKDCNRTTIDDRIINKIVRQTVKILSEAKIPLSGNEKVEISAHYGLQRFSEYGALIIDKINREYCKKIIVVTPGQKHPTHRHIKKEEAFELLHGDCTLTLNGKEIRMTKGKPILISRGVDHKFRSDGGCVIEEISTTHIPGDSIYKDPEINTLPLAERKIKIKLR